MAHYYGVNVGANEYEAAVDTSTTSKDVEIVVNATNVTSRQDLILAVEKLLNFIVRTNFPPA